MYFRQKETPSGLVLQLIQSYRNKEDKPRQRLVVSLGNAALAEGDREAVARRLTFLLSGQKELLDSTLSPDQAAWVDRILRQIERQGVRAVAEVTGGAATPTSPAAEAGPVVSLEVIEHSHATAAGPEILGQHAWQSLNLSQLLIKLGFNEAQVRCAQASVINRLVEPVTEHALGPWLENVSSLPDLLGETFHGKHVEGRFYRVADLLYENLGEIEAHLREQQEKLFGRRAHIYLYDLTNTYFEGVAAGNPDAKHGHSKEKRNDCPLVSLALAYDQDGLPLGHKVFAGNQTDASSFPGAVARLETDWQDLWAKDQRPLFVMDCGIGTEANLLLLRQKGYDYLVGERRSSRTEHEAIFAQRGDFNEIPGKGVFVKSLTTRMPADPPILARTTSTSSTVPTTRATPSAVAGPSATIPPAGGAPGCAPDHGETLPLLLNEFSGSEWHETRLFCVSDARGEKESAMLTKVRGRLEADLHKLALSIEKGKLTAPDKVARRIGRLCERHSSVSRYYEISSELEADPRTELVSGASAAVGPAPASAPGLVVGPLDAEETASAGKVASQPKSPAIKAKRGRKTSASAAPGSGAACGVVRALKWAAKPGPDHDALCGTYCLRSNRAFPDAPDMWALYTSLTNAEDGFRCLKSDLGLRPVHHQTSQRVRAHIFISVLALHLLAFIKKRLADAGAPARTWTTLKLLLRSHAYVTLTAKTEIAIHRLRKLGRPDQAQQTLYDQLGIKIAALPKSRSTLPCP